MAVTDRTVAAALRLIGGIDLCALAAAAMPFAWMRAIHAQLGLGELPAAAAVEYLARSTSLFYALHAALLLFLATDVRRHRDVIRFVGRLAVAHGGLLLWCDLRSGLPLWWAVSEAGGAAAEGVILLTLLRLAAPDAPTMPGEPPA